MDAVVRERVCQALDQGQKLENIFTELVGVARQHRGAPGTPEFKKHENRVVAFTDQRSRVRTETPLAALTDAELAESKRLERLALQGKLDPAEEGRLCGFLERQLPAHARASLQEERDRRAARKQGGGVAHFTAEETAWLIRNGHDPEEVLIALQSKDAGEYARLTSGGGTR